MWRSKKATIPKHKGTEKLQADLKKKMSVLRKESEQSKKSGRRKSGLSRHGEIAHFIEDQCPAVVHFDFPFAHLRSRAGECAFLVAEQFALARPFRGCSAIHRDEGRVGCTTKP